MNLDDKLLKELVEEIKGLKEVIVRSNKQNDRLERRIYWLTIIATIIAAMQLIPLIKDLIKFF